jgi:DNA-binding CsgD family transcriptional regulator
MAEAAHAVADGRPVVVTGEAGVGKTTLLRAVAAQDGRQVAEGGALATLAWMPYVAVARAMGAEPAGTDPAAVSAEVLHSMSGRVLLLDDLQWAAPETLTVVTAVAGRLPLAVGVRTGTPSGDDVLARLVADGFHHVPLEPLDPADALALLHELRPGLGESAARTVVRRAGGNPLLLRELAAGDDDIGLRRTVRARLRPLPVGDREAFELLALAGRPMPESVLGASEAGSLSGAGLVTVDRQGLVDVRHALLAEVVVDDLDDDRRRALHLRLGDLLADPGEAARHLFLAGDRTLARARALAAASAATRPGERAGHLRLAAMTSDGADADGLRLDAAEALEAAHDWDGVFEVLDQVTGSSGAVVARRSLVRVRAAWSGGRMDELGPALETGLAAVGNDTDTVAQLLRVEACRVPIFVEGDFQAGAAAARAALVGASPAARARGEYFLGTALACVDDPSAPEHLLRAIDLARESHDVSTEMTAANNLVAYHESSGSPGLGADLAARMAERGGELGLGYWSTSFAYQARQLDCHAGRYHGLLHAVEELMDRPLDPRTRDALVELRCLTLADIGRADEAARAAEAGLAAAVRDVEGRSGILWAAAEAALWGGRPRDAERYADEVLTLLPEGHIARPFSLVTRAWARFDADLDPATEVAPLERPMLYAVPHELAGLAAAADGRFDEAVAEMTTAARLWAPYHVRGELRCEWASGELLRRSGDVGESVTVLTMVEKRCIDIGLVAVLNRAHRSLRAAGERRTSPRSRGATLTGREREVLDLVGRGLTNAQIAARLGLSRRTVVAQIESASAKLGATNRTQAAVLAAADHAQG